MDKKKLLLVTFGHLSCDVNAGALPAALPYLRSAYNLDFQATGGLMFAFSCLSSVLQPILGLFADRHSKPWFIPLGIVLAGFGMTIMGFMGNYWAIFCGIVISGIGAAFFHPEGARFANKISGKRKGAAMSVFSIGGNSGMIIGPLLVSIFVGMFGMPGMSVFAILSLITATLLYIQISRMQPANEVRQPMSVAVLAQKDSNQLDIEAEELLEHKETKQPENNWREFSKLIFVIICRSITFTGCNTFIPLYWVSVFGQKDSVGAVALAIFGACGVGFNIIGGLLSDKIGYVRIIRIAFCLMVPMVFVFGLIDNVILGYLLLPCIAFTLYLPFSSQVVLGQKLLARNIGFASGVTLGLAISLGGVAQPLLGIVADNLGIRSIFTCLACVSLLGCAFTWLLSMKFNRVEE